MAAHLVESIADQSFYVTDAGAAFKAHTERPLYGGSIVVKRWDNAAGWVGVLTVADDEAENHDQAVALALTILGEA